ncbi:hypothetical protein FBULB1_2164 [Fusarium bulbicola]|nr:hypothetical protein FBULB1_2164 [Fusarium bulbicola]
MPPLRSAPTPVGRQRSEYPFPERRVMLRTKCESPTEPLGLDHSAKEPDDVVQTAPTIDETITLRNKLLYLLDKRQQGEVEQVRRQARANQNNTASLDHYRAWAAMRNATSERDDAEEKHKSIAKNKRDRQNAIRREKRKAARREHRKHRDAISVLDGENPKIEACLPELNDKIRPLEKEESNRSEALHAVRPERKESEKALAKLEDKAAIVGRRNLLYLEVDRIAEWSVDRLELFLAVIADDKVDDILCCRQAIRKKQAAMEVDDAPTRLEDDEQARD